MAHKTSDAEYVKKKLDCTSFKRKGELFDLKRTYTEVLRTMARTNKKRIFRHPSGLES